jgi:hypothetical protein
MKLNIPLVAIKGAKTVKINIEDDHFKVSIDFGADKETVIRKFTDEQTMFNYLSNFDIYSIDFNLSF